ncbi:MAG TPA: SDR family oxidoreductase [Gaiellaceae bacterium]|nr:SDR family oxidoreductase [Gaiellaceae bacterium]
MSARSGRLVGRHCLVTGGASGIGAATTTLFAQEGATVAVVDLERSDDAELSLTGDVADEADVERVVAEVLARFGRIDILVNNAGISGVGDLSETTPEQWDRVMRVNVRSVFLVSRAVVPRMQERRSGVVVNVASAIAETGLGRRVSYAASKGAVLALTRSMQVDCAPHGVRVNAVLPGTIHTPFVDRYLEASYADPEEGLRSIRSRQLTGELGKPEDVANAILYLASDESRFVLGSGLPVDGGLSGTRA